MIKPRLCAYLEKHGKISKYQSGCRANHSCDDNILRLEADIRRAQSRGETVAAVFLDLTAAFDKLWNQGAIKYLHSLGIEGRMLRWLAAFLLNRKIRVRLNGETSELVETENGCPQGSVLSPIIFTVVMNSLEAAITRHNEQHPLDRVQLSQFVDDGAVWVTSLSPKIAVRKLQSALKCIEQWSDENGFIINPSKTQAILFHKNKRVAPEASEDFPVLNICGSKLKYLTSIVFLGMTFDKKLTWEAHVTKLLQRCQSDLNLIKAVRGQDWGTDKRSLFRVYQACMLSKINYGSAAYNSAPKRQLDKLQVLQNHALRVITGARRYTPINALHIECGTLELDLAREANQLKYWARTIAQGDTLPTNEKVTEDPAYEYCKGKKGPLPYTQNVQRLAREYQLDPSKIQAPIHFSLSTLSHPIVDLRLCDVIKKSDNDPNSGNVAVGHISTYYSGYVRIFSDGSKDTDQEIAGGGYIVHNPDNTIAHFSAVCYQPEVSIYSCELAIIKDITGYIRKMENHSFTKYVVISDSLSALRSIISGRSKSRPELVYNILKDITSLIGEGIILEFLWVPSHVGILGNEQADFLAKLGSTVGRRSKLKLSTQEVYSDIKRKVYNKQDCAWFRYCAEKGISYDSARSRRLTVYSKHRAEDIAYTRLRLRACGLAGEAPPTQDTTCPGCSVPNTFEHLFFQCPMYQDSRRELSGTVLSVVGAQAVIDRDTLMFPPIKIASRIRAGVFKFLRDTGYLNKL
jgi:ribonuclease HI